MLLLIVLLPLVLGTAATFWLGSRSRGLTALAAGAVSELGYLWSSTGTPILSALILSQGSAGLALFVLGFSLLGIVLHLWQAGRRKAA